MNGTINTAIVVVYTLVNFFEIYIWEFESSINIIDTRKDNRNLKKY